MSENVDIYLSCRKSFLYLVPNNFNIDIFEPYIHGINYMQWRVVNTKIQTFLWKWRPISVEIVQFTCILLFVQQCLQDDTKGNFKELRYWPFVRGIQRWPMDSPHKGPVMRKAFSWYDVITSYGRICMFDLQWPHGNWSISLTRTNAGSLSSESYKQTSMKFWSKYSNCL